MSDQQLPGPSSGIPETPPVAVTPGEDGNEFYNTPATATPVNQNESKEDIAKDSTISESTASSQQATLIPGLNLVNDGPQDLQSGNNESIPHQSTEDESMKGTETTNAEVEAKNDTAQNVAGATPQGKQEREAAAGDAMEVDQKHEQEEVANGAIAVPVTEAVQNEGEDEHPEWEVDSSPYESSSDSTTDSSDESDDDEDYPILSPEEQARILMQAEVGSDDEGEGKGKSGGRIKTANELAEEAPSIPEIQITPDMNIVMLGHVQTIVENTALIEANVSGEYQVLEAGSLLCFEDRHVVGVVCETLGRVENPLYTVRYPSVAAIDERGITKGKIIYYVEGQSSFVFTQPLKGLKGSDASNFHDEEVGEDEAEFSDDEQEAEYKRKLKQKRQERKDAKNGNDGPAKARRGPPGPSKLGQTELNYDDDAGEDGYTPLARPKNLHEIMSQQEAPVEGDGHPTKGGGFRGGRGRGRGFDRGRGGRGRGGGQRDHRPYSHQQSPSTADSQSQPQPQPQPQPSSYSQPAYQQNQQPAFGMPQQFPPFAFPQQQQQQQQPYAQGSAQAQSPFPFQMPYMQPFQQPNPYQQMSPMPQMPQALSNAHINPMFLAALQQQQQQQQQPQQPQQQAQNPAMNFDQVKAQLDLLRHLSNGNQGPRPQ